MAHSNGLNDDRDMATSRLVASAPDLARALLAALDDLDAVKVELERDRSQVIDTVNALHSEIAGRQWMLEGRGPYEWDDDRYRDEFAAALGVIKAPIEVLRKIGADWSNCPTDPAAIKAARVNDRARATAAEAELTALRATEQRLRKALVSDEGPDLGATSREPSLQSIIFRHYAPHMSENDALRLTDRYLAALTETTPPMGQGEPGERA